MKQFAYFIVLLLIASTHTGFVPGTLVHSPQGLVAIEDLRVADTVSGGVNEHYQESIVTHLRKKSGRQIVCILLDDNESIFCCPKQRLYLPEKSTWSKASALQKGDALLTREGKQVRVYEVRSIKQVTDMHGISVAKTHIYYVSKHGVLVHNFLPFPVMLTFGWTFGLGGIEWAGVSVGFGTVLGLIGLTLFKNKKKEIQAKPLLEIKEQTFGSRSPRHDPEDDDDDAMDDEHEDGIKIFEKSAQHIFRKSKNHVSDTPANRKLIQKVASDPSNYLGEDMHGNFWFGKILECENQVWVSVRNNCIRNAGINEVPRIFNARTGLCNMKV